MTALISSSPYLTVICTILMWQLQNRLTNTRINGCVSGECWSRTFRTWICVIMCNYSTNLFAFYTSTDHAFYSCSLITPKKKWWMCLTDDLHGFDRITQSMSRNSIKSFSRKNFRWKRTDFSCASCVHRLLKKKKLITVSLFAFRTKVKIIFHSRRNCQKRTPRVSNKFAYTTRDARKGAQFNFSHTLDEMVCI